MQKVHTQVTNLRDNLKKELKNLEKILDFKDIKLAFSRQVYLDEPFIILEIGYANALIHGNILCKTDYTSGLKEEVYCSNVSIDHKDSDYKSIELGEKKILIQEIVVRIIKLLKNFHEVEEIKNVCMAVGGRNNTALRVNIQSPQSIEFTYASDTKFVFKKTFFGSLDYVIDVDVVDYDGDYSTTTYKSSQAHDVLGIGNTAILDAALKKLYEYLISIIS